ncbi:hypothetical protein J8J27_24130, partial [Mycobacterium tuberculosis]|nr:hypothetical protein [Mycobacterium tuberculosis]
MLRSPVVTGAALAALAADLVACALGIVFAARGLRRGLRLGWPRLCDAAALKAMFAVNRDILVRSFVLLVAYSYFARLGAAQGDVVLAANAI